MPCTGQFILKCEGKLKMALDMRGTWGVLHFLEELFEVFFLRAEKVNRSTKEEGGEASNSAKTETDVLCVCVGGLPLGGNRCHGAQGRRDIPVQLPVCFLWSRLAGRGGRKGEGTCGKMVSQCGFIEN